MKKVIVIGGGAAGMFAAVTAAKEGCQVFLYEKNEKLGKKLFITGKGRCNLTNNSDEENLLQHVARNAKFLYSAFYSMNSGAVMEFFEAAGVPLKIERGNRVFPVSDKSSDIIRALEKLLKYYGVDVFLNTEVKGLLLSGGEGLESALAENGKRTCCGVLLRNGKKETADAVIVATGGLSYPSTGSTGDGYAFAKEAGVDVKQTYPSLVPIIAKEKELKELQGVSLKNVRLTLKRGGKKLFEEQGELLFTHYGLSGPLVLTASTILSGTGVKGICGMIDLKPALSEEKLDARLLRDFKEAGNHFFKNSLQKLLPTKMIPVVVRMSGIAPDKRVNEVTKEERRRLLKLLKAFPFTVTDLLGFDEAIITRGGISVKEIDPATMEAKKVKNLYFAGEVLDVDAQTGGYNLQIAWSTGYLAGSSV